MCGVTSQQQRHVVLRYARHRGDHSVMVGSLAASAAARNAMRCHVINTCNIDVICQRLERSQAPDGNIVMSSLTGSAFPDQSCWQIEGSAAVVKVILGDELIRLFE